MLPLHNKADYNRSYAEQLCNTKLLSIRSTILYEVSLRIKRGTVDLPPVPLPACEDYLM